MLAWYLINNIDQNFSLTILTYSNPAAVCILLYIYCIVYYIVHCKLIIKLNYLVLSQLVESVSKCISYQLLELFLLLCRFVILFIVLWSFHQSDWIWFVIGNYSFTYHLSLHQHSLICTETINYSPNVKICDWPNKLASTVPKRHKVSSVPCMKTGLLFKLF